jgi:hypothetical protein
MAHHSSRSIGFLLLALFYILFVSCAEIQSPPGGQPDKTAPRLLGSTPKSGDTGITSVEKITLRFTEPVQTATGQQVFISPRPTRPPKIKIHGEQMEIHIMDSLKSNQTYTVQVNATMSDLRGNKLDSSIIIAFSTGQVIDSGKIAGFVTMNGTAQGGVTVALYSLTNDMNPASYDSLDPDYVTITGQRGNFVFRYLPQREFRLIAFLDVNKNYRFNQNTEKFAVPDRPIQIGGLNSLDNVNLEVVTVDTAKLQIVSASFTQNDLVKVRLTKETSLDFIKNHFDQTYLTDSANNSLRYPLVAFPENTDTSNSVLNLYFYQVPVGVYSLQIGYDSLEQPMFFPNIARKIITDKEPPTVQNWQPGDRPKFINNILIGFTFSELTDTLIFSDSNVTLLENETDTIKVSHSWRDLFHVDIIPEKLIPGARYRLDLHGTDIQDISGNRMKDSLMIYRFATLSNDSLGSISGQVVISLKGKEQSPVVLIFRNPKTNSQYRIPISKNDFSIDVPAGKYILSGFIDDNGNNLCDPGSISPFRLAETQAVHPDTISVRARFETAGITFEFK